MSFGQHISTMAATTGQAHNIARGRRTGAQTGVKKTTAEPQQTSESSETPETEGAQKTAYQNAVQSTRPKRRRRYGRHIGGNAETAYTSGPAQRGRTQKQVRGSRRTQRSAAERQRMLDLAFSDTTRETQARYLSEKGPQHGPSSTTGKLSTMVSRLITMCKNQLGQYTGDELYKRADYRLFLSAFKGLQGGNAEPSDPWEGSGGGIRLSQTMTKAQGVLTMLDRTEMPGDELEEVA